MTYSVRDHATVNSQFNLILTLTLSLDHIKNQRVLIVDYEIKIVVKIRTDEKI